MLLRRRRRGAARGSASPSPARSATRSSATGCGAGSRRSSTATRSARRPGATSSSSRGPAPASSPSRRWPPRSAASSARGPDLRDLPLAVLRLVQAAASRRCCRRPAASCRPARSTRPRRSRNMVFCAGYLAVRRSLDAHPGIPAGSTRSPPERPPARARRELLRRRSSDPLVNVLAGVAQRASIRSSRRTAGRDRARAGRAPGAVAAGQQQFKSMAEMQKVQPLLKALQAKHKGEPQELKPRRWRSTKSTASTRWPAAFRC